ncbi:MAG TPA: M55 family metallopeptidase [Nocardioidaceae bacterium]|nr:M55 family metallopeptidase [Nocardioidaceae bacterium]
MRALISADMEGATGVTCPEDCLPGTPQWDRFRQLFTGDVAAVAAGFFDAGVEEVLVNEAHNSMRNLLLERLDPRVKLLTGNHKGLSMMEGIAGRPDLVAFVGYHAGPGVDGVLSHTFLGFEIFSVTLNGRSMSEGYLNALLTAEHGARLALVSGDDATCEDAKDYAPSAQLVSVKEAVDRYTAVCLAPSRTSELLRDAAARSVQTAEVPQLPPAPYRCEVEFVGTSSAAVASWVPTVTRTGPRSVTFEADRVEDLYRCFMVVARLGKSATESRFG